MCASKDWDGRLFLGNKPSKGATPSRSPKLEWKTPTANVTALSFPRDASIATNAGFGRCKVRHAWSLRSAEVWKTKLLFEGMIVLFPTWWTCFTASLDHMPVGCGFDDANISVIGDAGTPSGTQTMYDQTHGLVVDKAA